MRVTDVNDCNNGTVAFNTTTTTTSQHPPAYLVWSCGISAIVAISALPLLGLAFRPFIKQPWYKKFLLFMMSTSVGILATTAMLFTLPSAIGIRMEREAVRFPFIKKMIVFFATVLVFFNFEIIFKRALRWRSEVKRRKEMLLLKKSMSAISMGNGAEENDDETVAMGARLKIPAEVIKAEHDHAHDQDYSKASLVWLILAGGGIHNFVDGMAIGVALSDKLVQGLGLALIILIEELPHKLGDIAIFLNSGLSLCRSVVYCFLACVPGLLGFIAGVMLGNWMMWAASWVYIVATGLFLYVAFVDILPEVVELIDAEKESKEHAKAKGWEKETFLQMFISLHRLPISDFGMIFGIGIAAFICAYGEYIDFAALLA